MKTAQAVRAQAQTFFEKVQAVVREIPYGRVTTYGQVAALCGSPRAARQVGWALFSGGDMSIPWHRVVAAKGFITIKNPDYSAELQKKLLEQEGIVIEWNQERKLYQVPLPQYGWSQTMSAPVEFP